MIHFTIFLKAKKSQSTDVFSFFFIYFFFFKFSQFTYRCVRNRLYQTVTDYTSQFTGLHMCRGNSLFDQGTRQSYGMPFKQNWVQVLGRDCGCSEFRNCQSCIRLWQLSPSLARRSKPCKGPVTAPGEMARLSKPPCAEGQVPEQRKPDTN